MKYLNENTLYPMLLIGECAADFKKEEKVSIIKYENLQDFREEIYYYSSIKVNDKIIVIEDIGFMPAQAQTLLLKFLEETKFKVVLLSTFDQVLPTIMSRMRSFNKQVSIGKYNIKGKVKTTIDEMEKNPPSSFYNKIKMMKETCPLSVMYFSKYKSKKFRKLALEFLECSEK